jgi:hypothetical protein
MRIRPITQIRSAQCASDVRVRRCPVTPFEITVPPATSTPASVRPAEQSAPAANAELHLRQHMLPKKAVAVKAIRTLPG